MDESNAKEGTIQIWHQRLSYHSSSSLNHTSNSSFYFRPKDFLLGDTLWKFAVIS